MERRRSLLIFHRKIVVKERFNKHIAPIVYFALRDEDAGQPSDIVSTVHLLVQETGGLRTLVFVVQCNAVVAPMLGAHPVHIEPPGLGVVLIHLSAADFKLQARGQHSLHSLLHRVFTPMSGTRGTCRVQCPL